jgi:hypothetical protein
VVVLCLCRASFFGVRFRVIIFSSLRCISSRGRTSSSSLPSVTWLLSLSVLFVFMR